MSGSHGGQRCAGMHDADGESQPDQTRGVRRTAGVGNHVSTAAAMTNAGPAEPGRATA